MYNLVKKLRNKHVFFIKQNGNILNILTSVGPEKLIFPNVSHAIKELYELADNCENVSFFPRPKWPGIVLIYNYRSSIVLECENKEDNEKMRLRYNQN